MTDRVLQFDPEGNSHRCIDAVSEALTQGKLVGLPTETAYIPCALPQFAARLAELRQAAGSQRLVLLPDEPGGFLSAFHSLSKRLRRLIRRGWPGPLVLEVPVTDEVTRYVESTELKQAVAHDKLLVTMPVSRIIDDVVARLGRPLVALMDFASPMATSAAQLGEQYGDRLEVIADAGTPRFASPPTLVSVTDSRLQVMAPGVIGEEMVHRMAAKVYLFVCTGNTCRSPMAEGLFRQMLADGLETTPDGLMAAGVLVLSAGLAAAHGMPASEESVSLLKERGINIAGHSSQPVTRELLQHSDHVFTMTGRHREQILRIYPELAKQVEVLSADGAEIDDPIGGSWDDYAACLGQIERALQPRLRAELERED